MGIRLICVLRCGQVVRVCVVLCYGHGVNKCVAVWTCVRNVCCGVDMW